MDTIKVAIQALKNASTTRTGKTKDVQDAVAQLSSTIKLLELSAPSESTFVRLADLLRMRMMPLYRISVLFTLEYTVAVFRFIYMDRIIPSRHPRKSMWENLAKSLISGVLDFLEDTTNGKHRETVAIKLFPLFCPLFFCQTPGSVLSFDGNLSAVVYQLLMTTAEFHAVNAGKLRDHDIGSKRLGLTILQTKELLAMESLLELFAILIPPVKGREKRTQFIKDVFDSSILSCGDQIVQCLESIASPEWSITASKIMNLLADSDISFPQPFEASNLAVNEIQMHGISSFYVDKSKFIANLDKDGQIETFNLLFSTILNISTSRQTNGEVKIIVKIAEPPIVGDHAVDVVSNGELSVSWTLKQSHEKRFGEVLKSRDLSIEIHPVTKLSTAKEVILDFECNEHSLMLKKEKLQSLSQLWAFPAHTALTSPLAPQPIKNPNPFATDDKPFPSPTVYNQPTATVFLDPSGNLSFEPEKRVNETPAPGAYCVPEETNDLIKRYSDDEILQPKSRVRSKKRIIPSSDDDYEPINLPRDQHPEGQADLTSPTTISEGVFQGSKCNTFQNGVPRTGPIDTVRRLRSRSMPRDKRETTIALDPIEIADRPQVNHHHSDVVVKPHNPEKRVESNYQASKKSKKRPAQEMEDDTHCEEKRPTKRPNHIPSAAVPHVPYSRKKYGRKRRNSSPTSMTPTVNFDEVPQADVPPPIKEAPKPRASAMKNKNGKPVPKAKRATNKNSNTPDENLDLKTNKGTKDAVQVLDPDMTLINVSDNTPKSPTENSTVQNRRSSRVAKALVSTKPDAKKSGINQKAPKKPKKAPWEEIDFLEKKLPADTIYSSDPVEEIFIESKHDSTLVSPNNDELLEANTLVFDDHNPLSTDDFAEYFASEKTATSPEPSPKKVIMIDLTHDDSPKDPPFIPAIQIQSSYKAKEMERFPIDKEGRVELAHSKKANPKVETVISKPVIIDQKIMPSTPLVDVKMQLKKIPLIQATEKVPIAKIERMTPPLPSPSVEERYESESEINYTLPRRAGNKNRLHNRNPETAAIARNHARDSGQRVYNARQQQHQYKKSTVPDVREEEPMDKIVDILDEINKVVIHKVTRRFEGVTDELHAGQRAILESTADFLSEMCRTSVRHFNGMVDLEEEYTAQCKQVAAGLHNYQKSAEQLSQCYKDVVVDHGRRSLSKKLPTTLFGKIPSIILNPKLRL